MIEKSGQALHSRGCSVGRSVGWLVRMHGIRDVQVIQSFSRDGKPIKYTEMLKCRIDEMRKC